MGSLPFGGLAFLVVMGFSLYGLDIRVFFNIHSMVLVIFGTIAILALCTPVDQIRIVINSLLDLVRPDIEVADVRDDLLKVFKNRNASIKSKSPMILYAQDLWQKGVDHDVFIRLTNSYMNEIHSGADTPASILKNVAKYPPSLGMMGTVIGMISLFSNLNSDNRNAIGPLLALAMTATFYGLIVSNGLIMPIADRLQLRGTSFAQKHTKILKIILLIHQGETQKIVEDELNGLQF
jgi:chemotaxis protein MotA